MNEEKSMETPCLSQTACIKKFNALMVGIIIVDFAPETLISNVLALRLIIFLSERQM